MAPKRDIYKGISTHTLGYIKIWSSDHPNKDSSGYVLEHRLVYEHYLYILFDEHVYIPDHMDVHHLNGVKDDNRIQNLQLISKIDHGILHHPKLSVNFFCLVCGSKTTYIRKESNKPAWHLYKNGHRCKKCYMREYNKLKKELK